MQPKFCLTSEVLYIYPFRLQLFAEGEKTEEATPHRQQEVRKKGQVPRSVDLNTAAVLLGVLGMLYFLREDFTGKITRLVAGLLTQRVTSFEPQVLTGLEHYWISLIFSLLVPFLGIAVAVGVLVGLVQTKGIFAPQVLSPRWENINPLEGIKRIFSTRGLLELVKSLLKVGVAGTAVYFFLRTRFSGIFQALFLPPFAIYTFLTDLLFKIAFVAGGVFLGIAFFDYFFQRRLFQKQIRMTREELKEEIKRTEGDPQVRARIRERQRTLARRRMLREVPQATVVITNPVRLAVALRYVPEKMKAPVLVAKGQNILAQRIITLARENRVPVVENPPLARALYRFGEIGREIPVELYQAVAEILVLLYRLGKLRERII